MGKPVKKKEMKNNTMTQDLVHASVVVYNVVFPSQLPSIEIVSFRVGFWRVIQSLVLKVPINALGSWLD